MTNSEGPLSNRAKPSKGRSTSSWNRRF